MCAKVGEKARYLLDQIKHGLEPTSRDQRTLRTLEQAGLVERTQGAVKPTRRAGKIK